MRFATKYCSIIIAILCFGCAVSNSKKGVDHGASLVPADSTVVVKGNIGEVLNETGIHENESILNRFVKKQINELEESGRDEELTTVMKQALDLESIGLDSSQPVYMWVKLEMKEFTFDQQRTNSFPHMTVGITGSISDKLKAEKGLKKLITKNIFPTGTKANYTQLVPARVRTPKVLTTTIGASVGGVIGNNRGPDSVTPAPKSAPAEKGDAEPAEAADAAEQEVEPEEKEIQLPWIERNGHKALLAVGDPVRIRGEEVDRQSLAIALTDNSFVIILSALANDQPDVEELVSQWLPKDTEKDEDDSPEATKERSAKKELFAQLQDMLEKKLNSPSKAKGALRDFLKKPDDMGFYASIAGLSKELQKETLKDMGLGIDFEKAAEQGFSLDQLNGSFTMNSVPGALSLSTQISVPGIKAGWVGKGIDGSTLDAVPSDVAVLAAFTLGRDALNENFLTDILPNSLKDVNWSAYRTYDNVLDELKDMEEEGKGWKMDSLINMLEGTLFIAMAPKDESDENDQEDAPPFNLVAGIKITDQKLFSEVYGALKAGGAIKELEEQGLYLVQNKSFVFICTENYKQQLEGKGKLAQSLGKERRKNILGKPAIMWADLPRTTKFTGDDGPWASDDPADKALTSFVKYLSVSLNVTEGRASGEFRLESRDQDTPAIRQIIESITGNVPLWEFETGGRVYSSPVIGSDGTVYVEHGVNTLDAINGKTGVKLWEFETGFGISSPAIGSDGTVYVGSNDKKLYALNGKTGVKLWEFETGGFVSIPPVIGSDGTVYVGSEDNKLYAINGKTGVKLWEFETGFGISSPAIGSDGTVYVGSNDKKLYALNGKTGVKLWEFETGGFVSIPPAIGSDGTVYVVSYDKKVYAINGKTGGKVWEFETGGEVRFSPVGAEALINNDTVYVGAEALINNDTVYVGAEALINNDTVYVGSDGTVYVESGKKLYAINGKTGGKLWEFEPGGFDGIPPVIGSDGTVYVRPDRFKVYAINGKTGDKLWEFETEDDVTPPAIGSDGTVYVGSEDNKLYAINGKTGVKLWEFDTGSDVSSSPAIGSDGTVYVGSREYKLYAFPGRVNRAPKKQK